MRPVSYTHLFINVRLRRDAGRKRLLLDLLAMLIRSGQKHDIKPLHPLVARHNVGGHGAVAVPDMQLIGRVINRRGDIKRLSCSIHIEGSLLVCV